VFFETLYKKNTAKNTKQDKEQTITEVIGPHNSLFAFAS